MSGAAFLLAVALSLLLIACNLGTPAPRVGPAPPGVVERFVATPPGITVAPWIEGLEVPWSLVFLPDGRALVSERPGRIRLIEDGRLIETPYATFDVTSGEAADSLAGFLSVFASGEGGLLGLAVDPAFPARPYIYAMQTHHGADGVTNRVLRLRDEGRHGRPDAVVFDGIKGWVFHNGGRIGFGPDGMLYLTTGEIFEAERAQDRSGLNGKILRLTPDGAVPPGNPFPGRAIYSYGHRNPQGLAWDPRGGALFASEHGPSGEFGLAAYDEINVIRPGGNYGWPRVVGAAADPAFIDPLVSWAEEPVPPAGMAFWQGDLFVAALGGGSLIRIALDRTASGYAVRDIERWFAIDAATGTLGRLRDAVTGPDGALYILTSNRDGRGDPRPGDDKIYRLSRSP